MKLEDMSLFVRVVDCGSFTKAADYFDMPKSTVSRRIRQLEEAVQARLLERTTRKLVMTETGQTFYFKAKNILNQVEQTQAEITQAQTELAGVLVLYVPDLLLELNSDQISEFYLTHPAISLEVHSSKNLAHHYNETRFDLMLSIGCQNDSSFIAHPVGELNFGYFCSPNLLVSKDLYKMPALVLTQFTSGDFVWNQQALPLPESIRCQADNPYLLRSLAQKGQGITCLPRICVAEMLANGELVEVQQEALRFCQTVYAIYHSRRFIPKRVSLLLEEIRSKLPNQIKDREQLG
ncbi:LysR family transcriptional regulator [Vibrio sonorensis]|uniref:LysR family transcriptional regulator n=1 Tax=Vibrio sonorensis TaxID=1004316 RepID=UPI0008D91168|nr:LysR family transcriptional regulator [Vibrio sonorensis]